MMQSQSQLPQSKLGLILLESLLGLIWQDISSTLSHFFPKIKVSARHQQPKVSVSFTSLVYTYILFIDIKLNILNIICISQYFLKLNPNTLFII